MEIIIKIKLETLLKDKPLSNELSKYLKNITFQSK